MLSLPKIERKVVEVLPCDPSRGEKGGSNEICW